MLFVAHRFVFAVAAAVALTSLIGAVNSRSVGAAPITPAPPQAVGAVSSFDGSTVTLSWMAATGPAPWIVERDGSVLAELPTLMTAYADTGMPEGDPAPNHTYHDQVCAATEDYLVCGRPLTVTTASVVPTTPTAVITAYRLSAVQDRDLLQVTRVNGAVAGAVIEIEGQGVLGQRAGTA